MDAHASGLSPCDALDPRIRRSRRMLHDALVSLMTTKEFDKISIADIADAATLNRATFYDHYPDKYALLECVIGSRFGELMDKRGIVIADCAGALRAITLAVCDFIADTPMCGGTSQEGSMRTAIVGVMRTILIGGLRGRVLADGVSAELVASTVAWAIYGAASAWAANSTRCSAEQIADVIDTLIKPIFSAAVQGTRQHRVNTRLLNRAHR